MKPWRKIHRDIFENEDLGVLSSSAFQLYTALIIYADDEGRLKASPAYLRGKAFRYRDDVKTADVKEWRDQLVAGGFVTVYSVDGEDYAHHHNWSKWQGKRNDRFEPSKLPEPCGIEINKERQPLGNQSATRRQPLGTPDKIRGEKKRGEGEVLRVDNDNDIVSDMEKSKVKSDAAPARASAPPPPAPPASPFLPARSSDKPDTIEKEKLADGQFPEAVILEIAGAYADARGMTFGSPAAKAAYLKTRQIFYAAKDLLTLAQGDVDLVKRAITDHAKFYASEGKDSWSIAWIVKDYPAWDSERREYEKERI